MFNLGVADMMGRAPHLVGETFLKHFGIRPGSIDAHAFTYLDFAQAARTYGKVGGFAHLATLVKQMKASRPGALLLDGGDTWQGSGTALWSKAQDMVDACKLLGVDIMTLHWESTHGAERVKEIEGNDFKDHIDIVAQNVKTTDFEDPVFKPYVIRKINDVPVAIIGQAFPYTPIANPRYFTPEWSFGIQDERMQEMVDEARGKGAQVIVVLSHNGMDVDIKMASRVTGIDVIFGGHTHDGMPAPTIVENARRQDPGDERGLQRQVSFAVMDLDVRDGKVQDFRYKLLPVFSNLLPADPRWQPTSKRCDPPISTSSAKNSRSPRAALSARQLQRFLGPAHPGCADGREGCGNRLLTGIPLGYVLAPGRHHHHGIAARPDCNHLPLHNGHRDEGQPHQDHPRRRLRQPLQSRPVLSARRGHGPRGGCSMTATPWRAWASVSTT